MVQSLIQYKYKFTFGESIEKTFEVRVFPDTLQSLSQREKSLPDWTGMDYFKCDHCPLNTELVKHCPLAASLSEVVDFFSEIASYENVKIEVETSNRNYVKETSVQEGVSSLLGIMMVTSGCPYMAKLRPLVKFHLPFGTIEETEFRVFSAYALAQVIRVKHGKTADCDFIGLRTIYNDIKKLNRNVVQKIADIEKRDASINSVNVLDTFANSISFSIDEDDMEQLELLLDGMINLELPKTE